MWFGTSLEVLLGIGLDLVIQSPQVSHFLKIKAFLVSVSCVCWLRHVKSCLSRHAQQSRPADPVRATCGDNHQCELGRSKIDLEPLSEKEIDSGAGTECYSRGGGGLYQSDQWHLTPNTDGHILYHKMLD